MAVDMGAATAGDERLAGLGWLGRKMERQTDLEGTLEAVVQQARKAEIGDAVGMMLVAGRAITVGPTSDPQVRRATGLQLDCGQGPGVETILTRRSYLADDLRLDARWRFWGPRAADAGWLSVLSVALADGETFGSLNVYSRQVDSFSRDDLVVAEAFAARAAVAVAGARGRRSALDMVRTRRLLRRAQYLVMQRLHVDADAAFHVLHRNASRRRATVLEVAADVVAGCVLPEYPSSQVSDSLTPRAGGGPLLPVQP